MIEATPLDESVAVIGPDSVTLIVCPVCGRDDRVNDLKLDGAWHGWRGERCYGKPVKVLYVRATS